MRRDDSTSPFDVEADQADDVTQQFWGTSRGWVSRQHLVFDDGADGDHSDGPWRDDRTGSLGVIREGFRAFRPQRSVRAHQSGQVERTRRHGVVRQPQLEPGTRPAPSEASLGELAASWHDEDVMFDTARSAGIATEPIAAIKRDTGLVPLSPVRRSSDRAGVGAIDPLLARIGMLIVVALLLVPIALALRTGSSSTQSDTLAAADPSNVDTPDTTAGTTEVEPSLLQPSPSSAAADPAGVAATDRSDPSSPPDSGPSDEATTSSLAGQTAAPSTTASSPSVGDVVQVAGSSSGVATASEPAERLIPACPATYLAGAGDSWYRIADAADVTPNALLGENRATVDTVILPGDEICLPAGATMPTQPTTTTVEPTTTQDPTTTAPATTAPATTQPRSTTPPTSSEVQQIIRDVFPDELEERALEIAWRESGYIPTAYNGWCCHGLFQIYWSVHVSWLDEYGIYSSADLLDARKNATAAYALYQRAGGWGPWGG
jgi:hypothetical protein